MTISNFLRDFPTARQTRLGLLIGLPLALIFGQRAVAWADLQLKTWTAGQPLKAADLNAEFQKIKTVLDNPAARYICATQFIPSDSNFHPVEFNTKDYDTHGAVTTGSNHNFQAPVGRKGRYLISTRVAGGCSSGNACDGKLVQFSVLAGAKQYSISASTSWSGGNIAPVSSALIVELNELDKVQVQVQANVGSIYNLILNGEMAVQRLGE